MSCKWGCDLGCTTYGQHLRNKGINYNGVFATRTPGKRNGFGDAMIEKDHDRRLARYEDLRKQGIQPSGHTQRALDTADRKSQVQQAAYDATNPHKNTDLSRLLVDD